MTTELETLRKDYAAKRALFHEAYDQTKRWEASREEACKELDRAEEALNRAVSQWKDQM